MLNNQKIEPQRYYELREKDVIKFGACAALIIVRQSSRGAGFSTRDYVLLNEKTETPSGAPPPDDED